MRNKIVMITAALAVMIALTGIAGAYTFDTIPANILDLPLGGTGTIQIKYDQTGYSDPISIKWWLNNSDSMWNDLDTLATDITADGTNQGTYSVNNGAYKSFAIVDISSSVDQKYWLTTCLANECRQQKVSVKINSIPEFATVAIPIAAVLGLVFFFQQRKNKKE